MANEKRLIDANALLEELDKFANPMPNKSGYDFLCGVGTAITEIENAPTVDAVEVVHGRWERAHIAGYLKCNCCKDAFIYEEWLESGKWKYCPNRRKSDTLPRADIIIYLGGKHYELYLRRQQI